MQSGVINRNGVLVSSPTRVQSLLASALVSCAPLYASAAPIDLDDPAAFEAIRAEQPALARQIEKVLAAARFVPPGKFPELVAASFSTATSAAASFMVRTSYPSLIRVACEVDGANYQATIPFRPVKAKLPPANGQALLTSRLQCPAEARGLT